MANEEKSLPWVHPGNWSDKYGGITKRELFAAMAMQGLLANGHKGGFFGPAGTAKEALSIADALLSALDVSGSTK